jgi:hypothetical protein
MNKLKLIATILSVILSIFIIAMGVILKDIWQVFAGVYMQLYIIELYINNTTKCEAEKLNDKLIEALNNALKK